MKGCDRMETRRNKTGLLLILTALSAMWCFMAWEGWAGIAGIITIILLVLAIDATFLGNGFTKGIYRKVATRHPFDMRFHPNPEIEVRESACLIHTSQQAQRLCFTLYMRQELSLQSIRFEFQANQGPKAKMPTIVGLFDWYNVTQAKPEDVNLDHVRDGAWYWRYSAAKLRYKQSQTTIGIECLAPDRFNGTLRFTATFNEAPRKVYDMPFMVSEHS